MRMSDIKAWIISELSQNTEFQQLCITEVGSVLNFYSSTPINDDLEVLPSFTVFSETLDNDFSRNAGYSDNFKIPFAIRINPALDPIESGNIFVFSAPDVAEKLAVKARDIVQKNAKDCGNDLRLLTFSLYVTQIGEADDVQAVGKFEFGIVSYI